MAQHPVLESSIDASPMWKDHLQELAEQISDAAYDAADAVSLVEERFAELAKHLETRFSAEERSGRFEQVLCHAPWLTSQAHELQQQHAPLIETLRRLRQRCGDRESPVAWWHCLRLDFKDFIELLSEHEAGEINLLRDVHPGPAWNDEDDTV